MDVHEFVEKYKPRLNFFDFTKEKICIEVCNGFWINSKFPCQDGEYCPFKQFFHMIESIEVYEEVKKNKESE